MSRLLVCLGSTGADEYGDRVAVAGDAELERVRAVHQMRSYRIGSVLRVGVVGLMVAAMIIGTARSEWPQESVLILLYGIIALGAVALAFAPFRRWIGIGRLAGVGRLEPFAFTVVDILALTIFQLLSTNGIYPLLIMAMLPVLLGLDVSSAERPWC